MPKLPLNIFPTLSLRRTGWGLLLSLLPLCLAAQERKPDWLGFSLSFCTEAQTNFKDACKGMNLLRTDLSAHLSGRFSLSAATLSTAETTEDRVISDWQAFSSLEAPSIPLTLAVLSLDWHTPSTTLCVGVRNFNENYFSTPLTSFFSNASHGIFPTIAVNCPIANYPVASIGADFEWRLNHFTLHSSLYNGTGYKDFAGRANLFRFCPRSDGLFGALALSHEAAYGNSHVGLALHDDTRRTHAAAWAYTEADLAPRTQLLAQYSFATGRVECSQYAALGLKQTVGSLDLGAAETLARFCGQNEWCTELTAEYQIASRLALHSSLHFVHNPDATALAALLRLTYEFEW